MSGLDEHESEILDAYEAGELRSVATKDELARLKAAARATGSMDLASDITGRMVDPEPRMEEPDE